MPSAPGHTIGVINMWVLTTELHPPGLLGYWFRANVLVQLLAMILFMHLLVA